MGRLATEIGGDKVSVFVATTGMQDPHRIEARPSLIARMRTANLTICSGADLEVGWLPVLLQSAGNNKVQPGQAGYLLAAEFVPRLDVPARVDRSMGDIHADGNPHIHLDPRNIARVAPVLERAPGHGRSRQTRPTTRRAGRLRGALAQSDGRMGERRPHRSRA